MSTAFNFEPHQFAGRRSHPVHADYTTSGDFVSPGIAFEDYERMSTQRHKQSAERRLSTPSWAVHNGKLRELLVSHLELRAGLRHAQPGTQNERLARATAKLKESAPAKTKVIKALCHEYVTLKRSDPRHPRLRELEIQIENLDTQLRLINKPAELLLGIVYHYYRACLDSVGTASALGIKPPMVRGTIWRLHRTWARMEAGTLWLPTPKRKPKLDPVALAAHKAKCEQAAAARKAKHDQALAARKQARAERHARIVAEYAKRRNYKAVATMFGVHWMTVLRAVQRAAAPAN